MTAPELGAMSERARAETAVLSVSDLTISLPPGADRGQAVQRVQFEVGAGEIVCVVGESGSGKSVIAHAVMGLLPTGLRVTGGALRLLGEDVVGASEPRLRALRCTRMGMVFQEPMTALNPVMSCGAQLDEVLSVHTRLSTQERRHRILGIFEQVRLPDVERIFDAYPHQLSGGQRQRIMIAMALILEPALLIADEPTTALDVTTQAQILRLIRDLQRRRGMGVLFITHDFGVVAEIADRVVVLRRGELIEQGTASQVLGSASHDYTRMLIASVPSGRRRVSSDGSALQPSVGEGPPVLKVRALRKTYVSRSLFSGERRVDALRDVSFDLRRGETFGMVGESGSGKSTVARCIVRLTDPSSGAIEIAGRDVATLSAAQLRPMRRKVQIVFQDPYRSLNPRRMVGESVIEGPMNYGQSRAEAMLQAARLFERVHLEVDALRRYPHQFSGGQRQRVCIARALAMSPELLIADEAVSALDVSVQAQVLALLDEIRRDLNLAILFITHDLRVAAQICDRVAVMSQGTIVEQGSAEQVFSAPQHPYTRALIEAAPGRDHDFAAALAVAQ